MRPQRILAPFLCVPALLGGAISADAQGAPPVSVSEIKADQNPDGSSTGWVSFRISWACGGPAVTYPIHVPEPWKAGGPLIGPCLSMGIAARLDMLRQMGMGNGISFPRIIIEGRDGEPGPMPDGSPFVTETPFDDRSLTQKIDSPYFVPEAKVTVESGLDGKSYLDLSGVGMAWVVAPGKTIFIEYFDLNGTKHIDGFSYDTLGKWNYRLELGGPIDPNNFSYRIVMQSGYVYDAYVTGQVSGGRANLPDMSTGRSSTIQIRSQSATCGVRG